MMRATFLPKFQSERASTIDGPLVSTTCLHPKRCQCKDGDSMPWRWKQKYAARGKLLTYITE